MTSRKPDRRNAEGALAYSIWHAQALDQWAALFMKKLGIDDDRIGASDRRHGVVPGQGADVTARRHDHRASDFCRSSCANLLVNYARSGSTPSSARPDSSGSFTVAMAERGVESATDHRRVVINQRFLAYIEERTRNVYPPEQSRNVA